MRAMLLCAGLSSRLGKLGAERPKPMLPVCGMPILAYGIANLVAHGITEIVINTHHLGDVIERELGDGRRFGAHITYIAEPQILGTGGGLKHALPLLDPHHSDEPFISMNGKLIFDLDITALVAAYRAAEPILGMMVVRRVPDAKAWGVLDVRDGAIVDFFAEGEHMFCGVHVTRPSVMARLPDGEADSIRQGYLPWLRAGEPVLAYEHASGYFAEHSTPERYLEGNLAVLRNPALVGTPPGPLVGIDPTASLSPRARIQMPVRIAPGAVIEDGATIGPDAVIGEKAHVLAGARVERSVVWAGAVVGGEVKERVVTTSPAPDRE
jgi:NDP-sugar pyrophosphorylase family protein